ncbi:hypothetical protein Tsubulata_023660 [Turnera subulata]|uniref:FAD/NAD(P)-binding domain-containing protein n=1 Tax=Turnera subulata TaxID=218843 RepID=A0A9Q0F8K0_9ROSI|nr:hypothetical protein Tsubulata_023660 [Turnera subulata]
MIDLLRLFNQQSCGKMCITADSRVGMEEIGDRKKVVVVGGGVGGSLLAYTIQNFADVVLIDQKEYFEIPWSSLRSVVEPSFAEKAVINHKDYLSNLELIVSVAVNVTETEVITADGHSISYDFLVIATGHFRPVPRTREERLNHFQNEYERLKSADSVLIIGGGPTGVELAGEIACDFPEKKIKLVHGGNRLLEFIGSSAADKALHWLQSKKVEVILDRAINKQAIKEGVIQTSCGEILEADCHFICTGKMVGSSWLNDTVIKDSLDTLGRVMVDKNLRIRGFTNLFAIGDITNIDELKQGFAAQKHALVVAKNLKLLMIGGNEKKLVTYKTTPPVAYVSLGRKEALAQFSVLTLSGWIPGKIKSKDLFVGHTRKQLGLKPNPNPNPV